MSQYATYRGHDVQVFRRFLDREECHACGNAAMDTDGPCRACGGSGYEPRRVEWARVGFIDGPDAGTTATVKAAALRGVHS